MSYKELEIKKKQHKIQINKKIKSAENPTISNNLSFNPNNKLKEFIDKAKGKENHRKIINQTIPSNRSKTILNNNTVTSYKSILIKKSNQFSHLSKKFIMLYDLNSNDDNLNILLLDDFSIIINEISIFLHESTFNINYILIKLIELTSSVNFNIKTGGFVGIYILIQRYIQYYRLKTDSLNKDIAVSIIDFSLNIISKYQLYIELNKERIIYISINILHALYSSNIHTQIIQIKSIMNELIQILLEKFSKSIKESVISLIFLFEKEEGLKFLCNFIDKETYQNKVIILNILIDHESVLKNILIKEIISSLYDNTVSYQNKYVGLAILNRFNHLVSDYIEDIYVKLIGDSKIDPHYLTSLLISTNKYSFLLNQLRVSSRFEFKIAGIKALSYKKTRSELRISLIDSKECLNEGTLYSYEGSIKPIILSVDNEENKCICNNGVRFRCECIFKPNSNSSNLDDNFKKVCKKDYLYVDINKFISVLYKYVYDNTFAMSFNIENKFETKFLNTLRNDIRFGNYINLINYSHSINHNHLDSNFRIKKECVQYLLSLLNDPSKSIRELACLSIGIISDNEETIVLMSLQRLIKTEKDIDVLEKAIFSIKQLKSVLSSSIADDLWSIFTENQTWKIKSSILISLSAFGKQAEHLILSIIKYLVECEYNKRLVSMTVIEIGGEGQLLKLSKQINEIECRNGKTMKIKEAIIYSFRYIDIKSNLIDDVVESIYKTIKSKYIKLIITSIETLYILFKKNNRPEIFYLKAEQVYSLLTEIFILFGKDDNNNDLYNILYTILTEFGSQSELFYIETLYNQGICNEIKKKCIKGLGLIGEKTIKTLLGLLFEETSSLRRSIEREILGFDLEKIRNLVINNKIDSGIKEIIDEVLVLYEEGGLKKKIIVKENTKVDFSVEVVGLLKKIKEIIN